MSDYCRSVLSGQVKTTITLSEERSNHICPVLGFTVTCEIMDVCVEHLNAFTQLCDRKPIRPLFVGTNRLHSKIKKTFLPPRV